MQTPRDHPPAEWSPISATWRDRLIAAMGLRLDPFRVSFAEGQEALDFAEIYVDPPTRFAHHADRDISLLERLSDTKHTFVFADYGHGKSATRLALEYTVRMAVEAPVSLAVRYTPLVSSPLANDQPKEWHEHLEAILGQMQIDLLIQSLERLQLRFHEIHRLPPGQRKLIMRLYRAVPSKLQRTIRTWARSANPTQPIWGDKRPAVLIRETATQWQAWLRTFITDAAQIHPEPWDQLSLLAAAHELGFEHIFVLLDAIDEETTELSRYTNIVRSILTALKEIEPAGVYMKAFLPIELQSSFNIDFQSIITCLTASFEIATISRTSSEHLDAIIGQRFTAASAGSASFKSLDWFGGPEIHESIQQRLITAADGSPRQLIKLISQLLDEHSTGGFKHDNQRMTLTEVEWYRFVDQHIPTRAPTSSAQP